jgi:hypothetical protein
MERDVGACANSGLSHMASSLSSTKSDRQNQGLEGVPLGQTENVLGEATEDLDESRVPPGTENAGEDAVPAEAFAFGEPIGDLDKPSLEPVRDLIRISERIRVRGRRGL